MSYKEVKKELETSSGIMGTGVVLIAKLGRVYNKIKEFFHEFKISNDEVISPERKLDVKFFSKFSTECNIIVKISSWKIT